MINGMAKKNAGCLLCVLYSFEIFYAKRANDLDLPEIIGETRTRSIKKLHRRPREIESAGCFKKFIRGDALCIGSSYALDYTVLYIIMHNVGKCLLMYSCTDQVSPCHACLLCLKC